MKNLMRKMTVVTAIAGGSIVGLGVLSYVVGARVNTSKSIPVGLYWTTDKPLEKGAYVFFCPPQVGVIAEAKKRGYLSAGLCPGGYGYMMKKVAAFTNDAVTIAPDGVRVNGELLEFSAPLVTDRAGRPLPRFQSTSFTIGSSEVLLMSDVSGTSFDGRYIGPVNRSLIRSVIVPIFTW
jgi:conjugative transfer signal peptidase TraF